MAKAEVDINRISKKKTVILRVKGLKRYKLKVSIFAFILKIAKIFCPYKTEVTVEYLDK